VLADELDYVIGVDTHRDEHVLSVVAAPAGAVVAQQAVRANARGYQAALQFADTHANGARIWAIEGAGHYGAGLARHLSGRGEAVLEIGRGPRDERRLQGKDDSLDATRAACTAPASKKLTLPRAGERREALRLLLLARRSRCSRLRRSSSAPPDELASRQVLRSLARRIEAATSEAAELERAILAHVQALAPQLLDEAGVGPIVAAQLIIAWSHQGRVRSEAAFARLAGAAPISASSGQTTRHRLSRGGDRQLNRALHTIILHRSQHDQATKDYIARRIAEGKTRRDAVRLLKRYLARHLYRVLQNETPLMT
jgi:hypothetical protein